MIIIYFESLLSVHILIDLTYKCIIIVKSYERTVIIDTFFRKNNTKYFFLRTIIKIKKAYPITQISHHKLP